MNVWLFLLGILLNHSITPSRFLHWLTLILQRNFWFNSSRKDLVTFPRWLLAGLISRHFGWLTKFSLWSFNVMKAFCLIVAWVQLCYWSQTYRRYLSVQCWCRQLPRPVLVYSWRWYSLFKAYYSRQVSSHKYFSFYQQTQIHWMMIQFSSYLVLIIGETGHLLSGIWHLQFVKLTWVVIRFQAVGIVLPSIFVVGVKEEVRSPSHSSDKVFGFLN